MVTPTEKETRAKARDPKEERLAVRVTAGVKQTLETAANLTGRSVSDFVVSHALEGAQATIESMERFRLAEEDRAVFYAALRHPPEPGEALKAAAAEYRKSTRG